MLLLPALLLLWLPGACRNVQLSPCPQCPRSAYLQGMVLKLGRGLLKCSLPPDVRGFQLLFLLLL